MFLPIKPRLCGDEKSFVKILAPIVISYNKVIIPPHAVAWRGELDAGTITQKSCA
jgi:hypothetical protein